VGAQGRSRPFPDKGVMKPEQAEIERLKMDRDILNKAAAYFARHGADCVIR
jgi:transposase